MNQEDYQPKKKYVSDEIKTILIRMWVAGMVCMMVAFTPLGGGEGDGDIFIFQMIAMLALFLFISNVLIVNPVLKSAFKTRLNLLPNYLEKPLMMRVLGNIVLLIIMIIITILIWLMYVLVNMVIKLFYVSGSGRPLLMLEPISFALFYGMIFQPIYIFIMYIYKKVKDKRG